MQKSFLSAAGWWLDYETLIGLPVVLVSGGPQCTVVSETRAPGCVPAITVEYRSRHWTTRQRFTIDARCMRLL